MAERDESLFQRIPDERLRGLYEYWRRKAGQRAMPARRDIDPLEMREWLGNLVLIEFFGSVEKYRIRLDGTNITEYYGVERTGKGIEALTSPEERALLLSQYEPVLRDKRPAYCEAEFVNSDGVNARQMKLLLPLSDDGEHVNMVLGGIYFRRLEA